MDIRSLAKQGYTIRQISRMTGLHRKTVRKYLQDGILPVYRKLKRRSKLSAYYELIKGWLSQENYQGTRIYELCQAEGYDGSYNTVKRYVRGVKEKRDRIAYIRFETLPGVQAQVDFGDFKIEGADGQTKTIYCFIMVLGYSRHMYVEFIEDCTMTKFLSCHQNAFGFLGGIPAEILYDNMKNVVIKHLVGKVQWNKRFEAFSTHYGYKPLAAPPYAAWVKGKVERPIHYIRERFWRGYVYRDLAKVNRDVKSWILNVASQRVHGTHRQVVSERFAYEKSHLGLLPRSPYDISEKVYRNVYRDCQIAFDGNRYVVPHEYVGQKVLLKIRDGILRVFSDDKLLAVYRIPAEKGKTLADPRFYERLKADKEQIRRKYRKPSGKAKATRGLLKNGLWAEVMARPLSVYDQEAAL